MNPVGSSFNFKIHIFTADQRKCARAKKQETRKLAQVNDLWQLFTLNDCECAGTRTIHYADKYDFLDTYTDKKCRGRMEQRVCDTARCQLSLGSLIL